MKLRRVVRKITWGFARTVRNLASDWLDSQFDPSHALLVKDLTKDVHKRLTWHDPMGLSYDNPHIATEYKTEAKMIASSLLMARNEAQVDMIVQSVMNLQFCPQERSFLRLSEDLWKLVEIYTRYKEYQSNLGEANHG
jgi:hypothetical protein